MLVRPTMCRPSCYAKVQGRNNEINDSSIKTTVRSQLYNAKNNAANIVDKTFLSHIHS